MLEVTVQNLPEVEERLAALEALGHIIGVTRAAVGTELAYAVYVSRGTRPHDIYPRRAKALAWAAPGVSTRLTGKPTVGAVRKLGAAAFVFAKHVHHPGTRPNPFIEQAIATATPAVLERLDRAVATVAEGAPSDSMAGELRAAGLILQAQIQRNAPVKTGTLRRAWHTEVVT